MLLYPTTVLFRVTRAAQRALAALGAGRPMRDAVDMREFEEIVDLAGWSEVEKRFGKAEG
jgi:hypothetical protein